MNREVILGDVKTPLHSLPEVATMGEVIHTTPPCSPSRSRLPIRSRIGLGLPLRWEGVCSRASRDGGGGRAAATACQSEFMLPSHERQSRILNLRQRLRHVLLRRQQDPSKRLREHRQLRAQHPARGARTLPSQAARAKLHRRLSGTRMTQGVHPWNPGECHRACAHRFEPAFSRPRRNDLVDHCCVIDHDRSARFTRLARPHRPSRTGRLG